MRIDGQTLCEFVQVYCPACKEVRKEWRTSFKLHPRDNYETSMALKKIPCPHCSAAFAGSVMIRVLDKVRVPAGYPVMTEEVPV